MKEVNEAVQKAGSAYKLARRIGCNLTTIRRIQKGERRPSIEMLARIRVETGIDMRDAVLRIYEEYVDKHELNF